MLNPRSDCCAIVNIVIIHGLFQWAGLTYTLENSDYYINGLIYSAVFAIANMVYVSLRIEGEHQRSNCDGQARIIYPHYFHLVFIVLQTFILAKDCKVIPMSL